MVDVAVRTRMQGLDEQSAQKTDKSRIIRTKSTLSEEEKQYKINEINHNKMLYRQEIEQKKANEALLQKTGLPEMQKKEALPEELQADPRYSFKKPELDRKYNAGKKAEEVERINKKYKVKMDKEQENFVILKAENNPTPKKEDDLVKRTKREEKKAKIILNNPRIPAKKKLLLLEKMSAGKGLDIGKDLTDEKQRERAERLTRKVKQPIRRELNKALEEKLLKKGART